MEVKNGTENEGKIVSGIRCSSARRGERERMGGNGRKLQEKKSERAEGRGGRYEGRRDRVREARGVIGKGSSGIYLQAGMD